MKKKEEFNTVTLKKEIEQVKLNKSGSEEEVTKMREYIRTMEVEFK